MRLFFPSSLPLPSSPPSFPFFLLPLLLSLLFCLSDLGKLRRKIFVIKKLFIYVFLPLSLPPPSLLPPPSFTCIPSSANRAGIFS
jgi:hypothetical protein